MSNIPSMNFAMAAVALSSTIRADAEAQRADEAEEALSGLKATELKSMGTVISKRDGFRAAAEEMMGDISRKVSTGMTADITDIRVRKRLLSLWKTTVPEELRDSAKTESQSSLSATVKKIISEISNDMSVIGNWGVWNPKSQSFKPGRGAEFVEGLDENEVEAVAKTGVANYIQTRLNRYRIYDRTPDMTRQQHRALGFAFEHAKNNAVEVCRVLKAPYQEVVAANLPHNAL